MKIKVEYIHEGMKPLRYQHAYDAGADYYMYKDILIEHGKNIIPLGFKMILPPGLAGYIYPRSSVMGDSIIHNTAPVDPDYSGEWHLIINNLGDPFVVKKDARICQIVVQPYIQMEFLDDICDRRDSEGIGSTGK